jgi:hypothetical protein
MKPSIISVMSLKLMLQLAPTNPATHDVHTVGDVHVMQLDGQIAERVEGNDTFEINDVRILQSEPRHPALQSH